MGQIVLRNIPSIQQLTLNFLPLSGGVMTGPATGDWYGSGSGLSGVNYETFEALKEPTGFIDRTSTTLSFDDGDRKLTISPTGSFYEVWWKGTKNVFDSLQNTTIPDIEGEHIIYYHNGVTLTSTTAVDTLTNILINHVIVSIVYWDSDNKRHIYFGDERHGAVMDGVNHAYLHFTQGTKYITGLGMSVTADGDGDDEYHAQFGFDSGRIADEDIDLFISGETAPATASIFYKEGIEGNWRSEENGYLVLTAGTGRAAWNEYTGTTWQKAEVTQADFVLAHAFATNDLKRPIIIIMGQAYYLTLGSARTGATVEINQLVTAGLPFAEFTPIGSIILQTRNPQYPNAVHSRVRTTDEGGDYVDFRDFKFASAGSPSQHGNLGGLLNDDHTQYWLLSGRESDASLSGDLYIYGDISTTGSISAQSISGNIIAKDGFEIETRIDDPTAPSIGRMWFRTDL